MKRTHQSVKLSILLFCSVLLAYLFSLMKQAHSYTILDHTFQFKIIPFLTTAVIAFFVMWIALLFCSKFLAWFFEISSIRIENLGILSYIPIFLILLLPLANTRFIDHHDFSARVSLFGYAILAGILFIKFVIFLKLNTENPDRLQYFWKKLSSLSIKKKLIVLFILALIVSNLGSVLMRKGGISFSGDEPHYLLITHSLLQDGDFNVANNYANEDYSAFMPEGVKLDVHLAPGTDGYSMHSPGISILLLPFYALGSLFSKSVLFYFLRFGMSIFGALLSLQIFLFALQEWKNEKIAWALWLVFISTSPIFFYSLHIYPEIILALFSLTIFRMLRFTSFFTKPKLLFIGILLGSFLWLHSVKYMFILIPFFLYCLWILLKKTKKLDGTSFILWQDPYFLFFCTHFFHTLFTVHCRPSLYH